MKWLEILFFSAYEILVCASTAFFLICAIYPPMNMPFPFDFLADRWVTISSVLWGIMLAIAMGKFLWNILRREVFNSVEFFRQHKN